MSRSHRHNPFIGVTTAPSDKSWKRMWSKWFRLSAWRALRNDADMPVRKSVQERESRKDGKRRFDPRREPELMRK